LPHPYIHHEKDNKNVWQQIYDQGGKTKDQVIPAPPEPETATWQ